MSQTTKIDLKERVKNDFTYHSPTEEMKPKFEILREKGKELALLILEHVPTGREQSSSLTNLEQTIMHANAGISRSA